MGEIQGPVDEGGPTHRGVGEKHSHLAVDRIAGRAGVLAGDAAGFRAFLQEAGLVDDQDAARRIPEMVDDVLAQIVAHRVSVPGGSVQEALDTLRAVLAGRLSKLPTVLTFDTIEQTS